MLDCKPWRKEKSTGVSDVECLLELYRYQAVPLIVIEWSVYKQAANE